MLARVVLVLAALVLAVAATELQCPVVLDGLTPMGTFDLQEQQATGVIGGHWSGLDSKDVLAYEYAVISAKQLAPDFGTLLVAWMCRHIIIRRHLRISIARVLALVRRDRAPPLSLSLAWRNGRHLESCHCSWSHTLAHATAGSLGVDCAKRTRRTIDTRTLARIASPRSLERRSLACSLARYALSLPSPRVPPSAHRGEYHRRASCHLSSRVDDCLLNSTRALSLSLSSLIRSMATACRKQAHIFASLSLSIPCAIQLSRASASLCLTLCLSSSD